METMFTRVSESIDFGLKSPEKPCKLSKKLPIDLSGRRSRKFESCHLDQSAVPTAKRRCLCCRSFLYRTRWHSFVINIRTKIGSEKRFSEPFSLPIAMQILRADRAFGQPSVAFMRFSFLPFQSCKRECFAGIVSGISLQPLNEPTTPMLSKPMFLVRRRVSLLREKW